MVIKYIYSDLFFTYLLLLIWWTTKVDKFQIKIGEAIVTYKTIKTSLLQDLKAIIIIILQPNLWMTILLTTICTQVYFNNISLLNTLHLPQIPKAIIISVWWPQRPTQDTIIKFKLIWYIIRVAVWRHMKALIIPFLPVRTWKTI